MIALLLALALGMLVLERLWPARALPRVKAWWPRVVLVNVLQLCVLLVAGLTWERWLGQVSLVRLGDSLGPVGQGVAAYLISTGVYYVWHRVRHESQLFWRLCHQLHHSPRRLEVVTSFFKHPLEVTINSLISAALVYLALGCSIEGGAVYTLLAGGAEFFYHWNVSTPRWLGYLIQRPESHRIHHQRGRHTNNYADLPIWDMLGGTFENPPQGQEVECGFEPCQEDRFGDMLRFQDVSDELPTLSPLERFPTCFGCSKRWACHASRQPRALPRASERNAA